MERIAFMFKIKEGTYPEYKKRHDQIWDDMKNVLKEAGRSNYSIWHHDNHIFGYYEVEDKEKAKQILSNSEVVKRWNAYMKDLIEPYTDFGSNTTVEMEIAFYLE